MIFKAKQQVILYGICMIVFEIDIYHVYITIQIEECSIFIAYSICLIVRYCSIVDFKNICLVGYCRTECVISIEHVALYCGVDYEHVVACPIADSSSHRVIGIDCIVCYCSVVDNKDSAVIIYGSPTTVCSIDRVVYEIGIQYCHFTHIIDDCTCISICTSICCISFK